MKKIIIIGTIPEKELMDKVTEYAEKHEAEIVYQAEPLEGEEAGIYKVGFPTPVTLPYTMAPYLAMAEIAQMSMRDMYADLACMPSDKPRSKYDKYARRPTQAELDLPKIGRNDPCTCGSGKKFKKCCALIV